MKIAGIRKRRQRRVAQNNRVNAPTDEDDHHNGDQLHNVQGFFAGFGNALGIFPPEIDSDDDGEAGSDDVDITRRERCGGKVRVGEQFANETADVLAGSNAADRAGQNVIKHQRGHAEFCQRAAERLFHRAVDAAAHEHAAAFDVYRAHGIRKQHDRQDEPGSGLADVAFGFTAGVVRGRSEVV